ncbi:MAG: phage portal protein [Clostridia bacterium]|nr:phage portal protein [Clostridia bacterium]
MAGVKRTILNKYPLLSAELEAMRDAEGKKDIEMIKKIVIRVLDKHKGCSNYMKMLYDRYKAYEDGLTISQRQVKFADEKNPINHKINNDFFGETVDIETGYFAGKAASYSYSETDESEEDTGGEKAVEEAAKQLNDFVVRNTMYDKDLQVTKFAAACGYAGRLFYIDRDGAERVRIIPPYECVFLSDDDMTEPEYAIRYYPMTDISDVQKWKVTLYSDTKEYTFEGQLKSLDLVKEETNLFDYCPLQGIPHNDELQGTSEKVLELIDAYDRAMSDSSNDIERFASAYMIFKNMNLTDEEMEKAQASGALQFNGGLDGADVYYLVKNLSPEFVEAFLTRTEDNIYRFSKTPNLSDEKFASSSGIALKFKITGLETKCGMLEAKMIKAGAYMFKLLASAWNKKQVNVDPLQCYIEFKRNFPLDVTSEAQAVTQLISAGLPKKVAFEQLSFVDDVDYIMDMIEQEKDGIEPLDKEENTFTGEDFINNLLPNKKQEENKENSEN